MTVADHLARVRARIADAGGDPQRVRIVAATKGQPIERVHEVLAAGILDVGESYAQELLQKAAVIDPPVRWHFIGRLQRNKVRQVAGFVQLWQSVDRLSVAAEIARHAPGAAVLVQVNVSGSDRQGGVAPERVAAVVEGCRDLELDVRGLMAIGPQSSEAEVRAAFARVRRLVDQLGLEECSIGMSGDLEVAVAEGTTMVRIGTDLVGPRAAPRPGASRDAGPRSGDETVGK